MSGPAGRDATGLNGGGTGWGATCPGSRIFEGARVDPVLGPVAIYPEE